MCGNNLGKRLILFSLTFALGVLFVNFFVSNKLPEKNKLSEPKIQRAPVEQKLASDEFKNMRVTRENCFPVKPVSEKPFQSEILNERFAGLMKQKRELQNRLRTNPDAPQKEKTELKQRLEVIEKQILYLFAAGKIVTSRKLLYVEECYDEF